MYGCTLHVSCISPRRQAAAAHVWQTLHADASATFSSQTFCKLLQLLEHWSRPQVQHRVLFFVEKMYCCMAAGVVGWPQASARLQWPLRTCSLTPTWALRTSRVLRAARVHPGCVVIWSWVMNVPMGFEGFGVYQYGQSSGLRWWAKG